MKPEIRDVSPMILSRVCELSENVGEGGKMTV
jgi:hypothetical protein